MSIQLDLNGTLAGINISHNPTSQKLLGMSGQKLAEQVSIDTLGYDVREISISMVGLDYATDQLLIGQTALTLVDGTQDLSPWLVKLSDDIWINVSIRNSKIILTQGSTVATAFLPDHAKSIIESLAFRTPSQISGSRRLTFNIETTNNQTLDVDARPSASIEVPSLAFAPTLDLNGTAAGLDVTLTPTAADVVSLEGMHLAQSGATMSLIGNFVRLSVVLGGALDTDNDVFIIGLTRFPLNQSVSAEAIALIHADGTSAAPVVIDYDKATKVLTVSTRPGIAFDPTTTGRTLLDNLRFRTTSPLAGIRTFAMTAQDDFGVVTSTTFSKVSVPDISAPVIDVNGAQDGVDWSLNPTMTQLRSADGITVFASDMAISDVLGSVSTIEVVFAGIDEVADMCKIGGLEITLATNTQGTIVVSGVTFNYRYQNSTRALELSSASPFSQAQAEALLKTLVFGSTSYMTSTRMVSIALTDAAGLRSPNANAFLVMPGARPPIKLLDAESLRLLHNYLGEIRPTGNLQSPVSLGSGVVLEFWSKVLRTSGLLAEGEPIPTSISPGTIDIWQESLRRAMRGSLTLGSNTTSSLNVVDMAEFQVLLNKLSALRPQSGSSANLGVNWEDSYRMALRLKAAGLDVVIGQSGTAVGNVSGGTDDEGESGFYDATVATIDSWIDALKLKLSPGTNGANAIAQPISYIEPEEILSLLDLRDRLQLMRPESASKLANLGDNLEKSLAFARELLAAGVSIQIQPEGTSAGSLLGATDNVGGSGFYDASQASFDLWIRELTQKIWALGDRVATSPVSAQTRADTVIDLVRLRDYLSNLTASGQTTSVSLGAFDNNANLIFNQMMAAGLSIDKTGPSNTLTRTRGQLLEAVSVLTVRIDAYRATSDQVAQWRALLGYLVLVQPHSSQDPLSATVGAKWDSIYEPLRAAGVHVDEASKGVSVSIVGEWINQLENRLQLVNAASSVPALRPTGSSELLGESALQELHNKVTSLQSQSQSGDWVNLDSDPATSLAIAEKLRQARVSIKIVPTGQSVAEQSLQMRLGTTDDVHGQGKYAVVKESLQLWKGELEFQRVLAKATAADTQEWTMLRDLLQDGISGGGYYSIEAAEHICKRYIAFGFNYPSSSFVVNGKTWELPTGSVVSQDGKYVTIQEYWARNVIETLDSALQQSGGVRGIEAARVPLEYLMLAREAAVQANPKTNLVSIATQRAILFFANQLYDTSRGLGTTETQRLAVLEQRYGVTLADNVFPQGVTSAMAHFTEVAKAMGLPSGVHPGDVANELIDYAAQRFVIDNGIADFTAQESLNLFRKSLSGELYDNPASTTTTLVDLGFNDWLSTGTYDAWSSTKQAISAYYAKYSQTDNNGLYVFTPLGRTYNRDTYNSIIGLNANDSMYMVLYGALKNNVAYQRNGARAYPDINLVAARIYAANNGMAFQSNGMGNLDDAKVVHAYNAGLYGLSQINSQESNPNKRTVVAGGLLTYTGVIHPGTEAPGTVEGNYLTGYRPYMAMADVLRYYEGYANIDVAGKDPSISDGIALDRFNALTSAGTHFDADGKPIGPGLIATAAQLYYEKIKSRWLSSADVNGLNRSRQHVAIQLRINENSLRTGSVTDREAIALLTYALQQDNVYSQILGTPAPLEVAKGDQSAPTAQSGKMAEYIGELTDWIRQNNGTDTLGAMSVQDAMLWTARFYKRNATLSWSPRNPDTPSALDNNCVAYMWANIPQGTLNPDGKPELDPFSVPFAGVQSKDLQVTELVQNWPLAAATLFTYSRGWTNYGTSGAIRMEIFNEAAKLLNMSGQTDPAFHREAIDLDNPLEATDTTEAQRNRKFLTQAMTTMGRQVLLDQGKDPSALERSEQTTSGLSQFAGVVFSWLGSIFNLSGHEDWLAPYSTAIRDAMTFANAHDQELMGIINGKPVDNFTPVNFDRVLNEKPYMVRAAQYYAMLRGKTALTDAQALNEFVAAQTQEASASGTDQRVKDIVNVATLGLGNMFIGLAEGFAAAAGNIEKLLQAGDIAGAVYRIMTFPGYMMFGLSIEEIVKLSERAKVYAENGRDNAGLIVQATSTSIVTLVNIVLMFLDPALEALGAHPPANVPGASTGITESALRAQFARAANAAIDEFENLTRDLSSIDRIPLKSFDFDENTFQVGRTVDGTQVFKYPGSGEYALVDIDAYRLVMDADAGQVRYLRDPFNNTFHSLEDVGGPNNLGADAAPGSLQESLQTAMDRLERQKWSGGYDQTPPREFVDYGGSRYIVTYVIDNDGSVLRVLKQQGSGYKIVDPATGQIAKDTSYKTYFQSTPDAPFFRGGLAGGGPDDPPVRSKEPLRGVMGMSTEIDFDNLVQEFSSSEERLKSMIADADNVTGKIHFSEFEYKDHNYYVVSKIEGITSTEPQRVVRKVDSAGKETYWRIRLNDFGRKINFDAVLDCDPKISKFSLDGNPWDGNNKLAAKYSTMLRRGRADSFELGGHIYYVSKIEGLGDSFYLIRNFAGDVNDYDFWAFDLEAGRKSFRVVGSGPGGEPGGTIRDTKFGRNGVPEQPGGILKFHSGDLVYGRSEIITDITRRRNNLDVPNGEVYVGEGGRKYYSIAQDLREAVNNVSHNPLRDYNSMAQDYYDYFRSENNPYAKKPYSDSSNKYGVGPRSGFMGEELNLSFGRSSKATIDYTVKRGNKIYFLVDGIDMNTVVRKQPYGKGQVVSITAEELRYLYRHKNDSAFVGQIHFMQKDTLATTFGTPGAIYYTEVPAPWVKEPTLWAEYNPKSEVYNYDIQRDMADRDVGLGE